jgi:inositol phosphorylceramide synthase catalytic subunit
MNSWSLFPPRIGALPSPAAWCRDWPVWWSEQGLFSRIFPVAFFIVYWFALYLLHSLHGDHIEVGILTMALAYGGRQTRTVLRFLLPLLMTVMIYDSMRFYADYLRGPIHVQEPYLFDKRFFGISTPSGVLTPNEYWQQHIHPALDVLTGFAYLSFVGFFTLTVAYFRFYLIRRGTSKVSGPEIGRRSMAAMWAFFWTNMIGYTTYYWYAAAPPWYVAMYGLGPARMDTPANPAGTVRFDQIMGTHFFTGFYGRAADVFGAIPSLHVSYPFIAMFFAYRFGSMRAFTTLFYLLMCFSAVYLNHHYVLDILWGSGYALIISIVIDRYYTRAPRVAV